MKKKLVARRDCSPGERVDHSLEPVDRVGQVAARLTAALMEETLGVTETYTALRLIGRMTREVCAQIVAKGIGCPSEDPRVLEALEIAVASSKSNLEAWGSEQFAISMSADMAARFSQGSFEQN